MTIFENVVWGRYLGLGGTKHHDTGDIYVVRSFMTSIPH